MESFMAEVNQKRWFYNALFLAIGALLLDWTLVGPYFDKRKDYVDQRDKEAATVKDAQLTLQKEKQLRKFLAGDGASMTLDTSAVEGQLLHLVHDWEQQSTVSNGSFQRSSAVEDHGFTRMTFQISSFGPMRSVAAFLFRVETSPIPLRIDNIQLAPKTETGEDVQIQLAVSALCRSSVSKNAQQFASGAAAAGGQQ